MFDPPLYGQRLTLVEEQFAGLPSTRERGDWGTYLTFPHSARPSTSLLVPLDTVLGAPGRAIDGAFLSVPVLSFLSFQKPVFRIRPEESSLSEEARVFKLGWSGRGGRSREHYSRSSAGATYEIVGRGCVHN